MNPASLLLLALVQVPVTPAPGTFEIRDLAEGVWIAEVTSRPPFYAFANSLIAEFPDGLLIVDTQQSPSAARALIERLPELSEKPVRWVVNTHAHADHVLGNQAYREAFPGARFIAHRRTAEDIAAQIPRFVAGAIRDIPPNLEARRRWLAEGKDGEGNPLTPEGREAVRYSVRVRERYLRDLESLKVVAPDEIVDDSLVIRSGTRSFTVRHLGPAHTPGDVVVWIPDRRVAAAGDLVEPVPWVEGSNPTGWTEALHELVALGDAAIVPAHGPTAGARAVLQRQLALFEAALENRERGRPGPSDSSIPEKAKALIDAGASPAAVRRLAGSLTEALAASERRKADTASPEAVVEALYASLQRAPGERFDWARLRELYLPGARLIPNLEQTGGDFRVMTVEEFIAWVEALTPTPGSADDVGFQEEEIRRCVRVYGDVAQVFSSYQKHFWDDSTILGRGINAIQLVRKDGRWWVSGAIWDEEAGAGPLPEWMSASSDACPS